MSTVYSTPLWLGSCWYDITVKTAAGAVVTAQQGSLQQSAAAGDDGRCRLKLPRKGSWNITASGGGYTAEKTILVPEVAELTLPLISEILEENSWATIAKVAAEGRAQQYWAVGDTKKLVLSGTVGLVEFDEFEVSAFIIGFDHNAEKEGTGRIHFQLGKVGETTISFTEGHFGGYLKGVATGFTMQSDGTNTGGWAESHMRKDILGSHVADAMHPITGTLLAALPEKLRAAMKPCTKYTDNVGDDNCEEASITATQDWLFLLSEFEYGGIYASANEFEQNYQQRYAYYAAGGSGVKKRHNCMTQTSCDWLRSPTEVDPGYCCINRQGECDWEAPEASYGVAPAFTVGT